MTRQKSFQAARTDRITPITLIHNSDTSHRHFDSASVDPDVRRHAVTKTPHLLRKPADRCGPKVAVPSSGHARVRLRAMSGMQFQFSAVASSAVRSASAASATASKKRSRSASVRSGFSKISRMLSPLSSRQ